MTSTDNELSIILNEFTQNLRENGKKKFRFFKKKIERRLFSKYKEAISKVLSQHSEIKHWNKELLRLRGLNLVLQGDLVIEESEESLEESSAEESIDAPEESDQSIDSDIEYSKESNRKCRKLDDIPEASEDEFEKDTFDCHICEKVFKNRYSLKRHLETHKRRFKCNRCGDEFKTLLDLQVHRHVHAHEKPFKCDFCGIGFKVENNMREHRRIHTGEKYKCDVCDKQFTQKPALYAHRKIHTDDGIRPFECDQCDKRFRTACQLKSHGLVHTEERPYNCDLCSKNYKYPRHLRKRFLFLLLE